MNAAWVVREVGWHAHRAELQAIRRAVFVEEQRVPEELEWDEIDAGTRPGTTTEESAQVKAMKKEIAELKRANEILKAAASFFAAELDRPHTRS